MDEKPTYLEEDVITAIGAYCVVFVVVLGAAAQLVALCLPLDNPSSLLDCLLVALYSTTAIGFLGGLIGLLRARKGERAPWRLALLLATAAQVLLALGLDWIGSGAAAKIAIAEPPWLFAGFLISFPAGFVLLVLGVALVYFSRKMGQDFDAINKRIEGIVLVKSCYLSASFAVIGLVLFMASITVKYRELERMYGEELRWASGPITLDRDSSAREGGIAPRVWTTEANREPTVPLPPTEPYSAEKIGFKLWWDGESWVSEGEFNKEYGDIGIRAAAPVHVEYMGSW